MKTKYYLFLTILFIVVFASGCTPQQQKPETQSIEKTSPSEIKQTRDDFGCFPPSCSSIPDPYGKQQCEDWKAGKNVMWPPDCKLTQTSECIKLCETEKKGTGETSSAPVKERDDFGCFYSCEYFPEAEGAKQMCEDWKAGKEIAWPSGCIMMQYGPCIKLCELEKKKKNNPLYNPEEPEQSTDISKEDPGAENVYIYIVDVENYRIVRIEDFTGKGWVAFGSKGTGVNQFNFTAQFPSPSVDSKGRVYIPDVLNSRIVRIDDMTGKGWTAYGERLGNEESDDPRVGKFTGLVAVALDSKERIYILEQGIPRVIRVDDMQGNGWTAFGKKGTILDEWVPEVHCGESPLPWKSDGVNVFSGPKAMTVDYQDRIYVIDKCNYRVVRFDDMTGKNWVSFGGKRGSGVGEFADEMGGVTVDFQGRIYVMDEHNQRIIRMDDMAGNGYTEFSGLKNNKLSLPHVVAISKSGKIYITDSGNNRIIRMDDFTGKGWVTFGSFGNGVNQFNEPKGMFVVEKE